VLVLTVLPHTAYAFDIDELMAMMGRVETSTVAFESSVEMRQTSSKPRASLAATKTKMPSTEG
jgi:hypothetical protein